MSSEESKPRYWLVSYTFHKQDYLDDYLKDGIWRIPEPSPKNQDMVKSMKAGDRIAAKVTFSTKSGLPFDNNDSRVSVMRIKAVGTIVKNPGDGEHVEVDWTDQPDRDWYFFTYLHRIACLNKGDEYTQALIRFAFEGEDQDLDKFLSHPFWHDRYLDKFGWIPFFEGFATTLLEYRDDRAALLEKLQSVGRQTERFSLADRFPDGTEGVLRDICPFTTMGILNRSMTWEKRSRIGKALQEVLDLPGDPPRGFTGVPCLGHQEIYFFPLAIDRHDDHIEKLWHVFECGVAFADSNGSEGQEEFIKAFDEAKKLKSVSWNLTFALYWARPRFFLGLDSKNRDFLARVFRISLKDVPTAEEYVALMERVRGYFAMEGCPVKSFAGLSTGGSFKPFPPSVARPTLPGHYDVQDIVDEGCFLSEEKIQKLLDQVTSKKNLILQGPPGTGKTWLARRLGYALVGRRDDARVKAVQFHPNLSYEDFVRGYRPSGEGKLLTADGIFMNMVGSAIAEPDSNFVLVIEEINRGNPSQIFGELLTLLEASKRDESEAIELTYPDQNGDQKAYVPANLHVIGTMNLADRSLALVDFALRRRFAFADLSPELGDAWKEWVKSKGLTEDITEEICRRMKDLNDMISGDARLGKQFQVGHSYVTPVSAVNEDPWSWFQDVVEHEISPLLEEYWFDSPQEFDKAVNVLKQPFA